MAETIALADLPEDGTFLGRLRQGLLVLAEALVQGASLPYTRVGWSVDRVSSHETVSWFLAGHGVLFMCGMQQPAEWARFDLCRALCDGKCEKCPARDVPRPLLGDLFRDRPASPQQFPCPMDEMLRELGAKSPPVHDFLAADYGFLAGKDRWYQGLPWIYVGPEVFAVLREYLVRIRDLGALALQRGQELTEEAEDRLLKHLADKGIPLDPAGKWRQAADDFLSRWLENPERWAALEAARKRMLNEIPGLLDRRLQAPLVGMCIWAIRQGVDDSSLMDFIRAFVGSRVGRREPGLVDTVINDLVQKYRTPVFQGGVSRFVKRLAVAARGGVRDSGRSPYTADAAALLITEAGYPVERTTLYRWLREGKVSPIGPKRTVYLADGLVKRRVKDMRLDEDGFRRAFELAREKTLRPAIVKLLASKKGITPRAARRWLKRRRDAGISWDKVVAEVREVIGNG